MLQEDTHVDVSNWRPYNLDPLIERALSQMGFSTPTPIQQECLPAAIRDRRDVIGAAQTVRLSCVWLWAKCLRSC